MVKNFFLPVIGLLLSVAAPPASAEIYRWVDENGQVHFEDRSKDQSESGVRKYSIPSASTDTPEQRMEKTRKLLNAYEAERRQARDKKAEQKKRKVERKRQCLDARDDLRLYQEYGSIYRLDEEGNRVYASDQERDGIIQRARERVAEYCDG